VVFQEYSLVNGTWDVRSVNGELERVRPQDITTTALFSVEGELDDISGSGQTEAVHSICSGVPKARQKHLEAKGAGHYGIFSGRRWREIVYPAVKSFILANALVEKPVQAPTVTTTSTLTPTPTVNTSAVVATKAVAKKAARKA
jgi:poly(3-hydroxybutyrate) depolymerase